MWYTEGTVTEPEWQNILKSPPYQGERILAKTLGGQTRIFTYDRYDYTQWGITQYKRVPSDRQQSSFS